MNSRRWTCQHFAVVEVDGQIPVTECMAGTLTGISVSTSGTCRNSAADLIRATRGFCRMPRTAQNRLVWERWWRSRLTVIVNKYLPAQD